MARVTRSPAAEAYRRADLPSGRTDWRAASWAVVDLETTGLDPARDEIISVAVVPVDGGRIAAGDMLYRVVRPARMPEAQTIRIHGLRAADLEAAAALGEVLDEVLAALAGRVPVAHAAFVERAFLEPVLTAAGVRLRSAIADTRELGRVWSGEQTPPRAAPGDLGELAQALGLPVHRPHHALGDALTTAQVFLALATHLAGSGRLSVKALLELSAPRRPGGR